MNKIPFKNHFIPSCIRNKVAISRTISFSSCAMSEKKECIPQTNIVLDIDGIRVEIKNCDTLNIPGILSSYS